MKDLGIDEFINIVYPKIKQKVIMTQDLIAGDELILTGVKEVEGEKIDVKKVYKMDVPCIIQQDHKTKLRLAYLRGGKNGVRNYLKDWLDLPVLDAVMGVL